MERVSIPSVFGFNKRAALRWLFIFNVLILVLLGLSGSSVSAQELPGNIQPAPYQAPVIGVSLDVPDTVMLGEDFSFPVTFDNSGDVGYGPFIDILFPVNGADGRSGTSPNSPRDGVDFVSAFYEGQQFLTSQDTLVVQTFPEPGSSGTPGEGCVNHPYAREASGDFVEVCGVPGDKLVTLRLPFGSFADEQPPAVVNVNATFLVDTFSDYADVGTPLTIKARGGFMFGENPLDDWCCGDLPILTPSSDDGTGWPSDTVTPQIMTVSKSYNGPSNKQDETATGPNYPRSYTLTVEVAPDQTITDLTVTDILPASVQFVSVTSNIPYDSISAPSTATPGGSLVLGYNSVLNTDITITVNFYVPRLDSALAEVIDAVDGDDTSSVNTVSAVGDWTPNDIRDLPAITVTAVGVPGTHTLQNKSIAIQKAVSNQTDPDYSPGDTLLYTLEVQVSDFFAFGRDIGNQTPGDSDDDLGIVVTDLLSDGQRVVPGSLTFALNGNPNDYGAASFNSANFDIDCNYSGPQGLECTGTDVSLPVGTSQLTFRVSDEIAFREGVAGGRMVGGCIDPVNGSATPDCTTDNDGPTTATITFLAIIQDKFTDDHLANSGDESVDQGDVLTNEADVEGYVLDTETFAVGEYEDDDAGTSISIKSLGLTKNLYALNGSTDMSAYIDPGTGKLQIKPGDLVTYQVTYELFTSDVEEMVISDYFPLPVFDVDDPDSDGVSESWSFAYNDFSLPSGNPNYIPPAGVVSNGPDDTFYAYVQDGLDNSGTGFDEDGLITGDLTANTGNPGPTIDPVVSANIANNRVDVAYANYDDIRQTGTKVDLLFSVVATDQPFADRLFLTNQARAEEGSTNSTGNDANAIVQVILTQPVLRSTKTVVWTSSVSESYDPTNPPVTFLDPTFTPRWSTPIGLSNVDDLDSDVSGLDAGDTVTFAIVIQNTGSSLKGAFDILIQDTLPAEFQTPSATYPLNLQIYFGDGSGYDYGSGEEAIRWTGLGGGTEMDLFGAGIELDDPGTGVGICQAHDPGLYNDIIIITYDLYITGAVAPGEIENTSSIVNYAGEEGGPNHLPEPLDDTAVVDVNASPSKSLHATSEAHTTTNTVVIGEIIRYQMSIRLPEATMTNLQFQDYLPPGLTFLNDDTATVWFDTSTVSNPPNPDEANLTTSGYGSIPAIPVTCLTAAPCTLSDWNIGATTNETQNDDNYTSGRDVYFRLGNIVNNDRDVDEEFVYIEFNALVHNEDSNNSHENDDGDWRNNRVRVLVDGVQSGTPSPNVGVRVREPWVTVDKTHSVISATIEAGDLVTYTVELENTALVDAFDVDFEDLIPDTYLTLDAGSVSASADFAPLNAVNTNPTGTDNEVTISIERIPAGGTVTIQYQVTATTSVIPGQAIDNLASAIWTSLPGAQGTQPNPTGSNTPGGSGDDDGERTGDGNQNDYTDDAIVSINVTDPLYSKSIPLSSHSHTVIPAHAVGEIATFRLEITLPQGTAPTLEIVDDLPDGLAYIAGSAELITLTGQSAVCPLASDFGGTISGSDPSINAPGGSGGDVTFSFGTILVSSDGIDTNNTFVICFEALVVNSTDTNNGDTLTNSAAFTINGETDTQTADVEVVEPVLEITKVASDDTPADGELVSFTITVAHGAGSTADAFDVVIEDLLPAELTIDETTLTITPSGGINPAWITDNSTGGTISYTISEIPEGESVQITFDATVGTLNLTDTFDNIAGVTWTSLPEDDDINERDSGGGVDDHQDTDTLNLRVLRDLTKAIVADNHAVTTTPEVTIGELLTYEVTIVVPPDSTDIFTLTDQLDEGLVFVDCETITAGANLTSSTITFNAAGNCAHGAAGNPQISNGGRTIIFDLGTVTNSSVAGYDTIILRYQVAVLDTVENYDGNGLTYSNEVELVWGEGRLEASAEAVTILESEFSLEKTVQNAVIPPGEPVVFYLAVAPTVDSNTTGYDLVITDVIPVELEIPVGGIVVTTVSGLSPDRYAYEPTTRTLTIEWDAMGPSQQALVSFEVLMGNISPHVSVVNLANLEWTSLPGTPTAASGQPEGVQSPYDENSTERDYDPGSPADLTYFATSSIDVRTPVMPDTGFAPGRQTVLPAQPAGFSYQESDGIQVEIPKLEVQLPVVGVPLTAQGWDVTWLGNAAGYLESTAYPTWPGNTALTAHVYTANGLPGPFVDLHKLNWGDEIVLHASGYRYTYQVRAVRLINPDDLSVLGHQDLDYLTLITCRNFDEAAGSYRWRTVVQAVLVSVTPE